MTDGARPPLALRVAMEAGDVAAAVACFTPDAVLRSPLTDRLTFRGRHEIAIVTEIVIASFKDLRYSEEIIGDHTAFLASHARVAGREIEIADRIAFDDDGQIRELRVFCRPLPAAAFALRIVGSQLARRKSGTRAAVVSAATLPLTTLAAVGDLAGAELIRPAIR